MNIFKAILLTTLVAVGCVTAVGVQRVSAVELFTDCGANRASGTPLPAACSDASSQQGNNGTNNPVINDIKIAINIMSFVVGIAAVVSIIVGGLRMIVGGGDASAQAAARNSVIYAVVGIVVVVVAQTIVLFVLDKIA